MNNTITARYKAEQSTASDVHTGAAVTGAWYINVEGRAAAIFTRPEGNVRGSMDGSLTTAFIGKASTLGAAIYMTVYGRYDNGLELLEAFVERGGIDLVKARADVADLIMTQVYGAPADWACLDSDGFESSYTQTITAFTLYGHEPDEAEMVMNGVVKVDQALSQ